MSGGWTAPKELNTPSPRAVKATKHYKMLLAIVVVVMVIPIGIFSGLLEEQIRQRISLGADGADIPTAEYMLEGVVVLFVLFAVRIVGNLVRTYRREKKLLAVGGFSPAQIVGEREVRGRNKTYSNATYSFADASGTMVTGIRKYVPIEGDGDPRWAAVRRRILENPTALYDPENSARNILWPPSYVELMDGDD